MLVAAFALVLVVSVGLAVRSAGDACRSLRATGQRQPWLLTGRSRCTRSLSLVAVVGFGLRFRARGERPRPLARARRRRCPLRRAALRLHAARSQPFVSQGDFLRLLAYAVLLVGVWRAIRFAEFGRAVADERARVAREIHDGLAQYLFAVSTHATMLENGAPQEETFAAAEGGGAAAQQEARFAILALSSASGTAPFDAALRRYIDFLTADGELEVDLEIDGRFKLAPDEQIEVFRIVQEGLANARKHANATRADVEIGLRGGERVVTVATTARASTTRPTPRARACGT